MRLLICGIDAEGRSCLASQTEVAFSSLPGLPSTSGMAKLYATSQSPPPACPPGSGKFTGGTLEPGHVSWYVMDHRPKAEDAQREHAGNQMHYRNAIDLLHVLEGEATLLLGDGSHPIEAGDCIVMPGSDHGLRAGPNGCRLLSLAIGTPRFA